LTLHHHSARAAKGIVVEFVVMVGVAVVVEVEMGPKKVGATLLG